MIPRMSLSLRMRNSSPSILTSVPPYLEMRTLSPTLTVNSMSLPSSSLPPVPRRALQLPGVFPWRCREGRCRLRTSALHSSMRLTSTRDPRGLIVRDLLFLAILLVGYCVFLVSSAVFLLLHSPVFPRGRSELGERKTQRPDSSARMENGSGRNSWSIFVLHRQLRNQHRRLSPLPVWVRRSLPHRTPAQGQTRWRRGRRRRLPGLPRRFRQRFSPTPR